MTSCLVAVTEGVEKATIEDDVGDKKDRTVVKDKSAKLEAKLERENKKKMVSHCRMGHSMTWTTEKPLDVGLSCTHQTY